MKLGHFRDLGLHEEDALLRIKSGGQPVKDHLTDIGLQVLDAFDALERRQCVNVNDAVDALVLGLEADIILDSSEVVTDVLSARGSGAGENALLHQLG